MADILKSMIKDSGERTTFSTGAQREDTPWRDNAEGGCDSCAVSDNAGPVPRLWKGRKTVPRAQGSGGVCASKGALHRGGVQGRAGDVFPEDIIQCDLPGPPPMDYDLKYALVTLTEVDKKIMAALGTL